MAIIFGTHVARITYHIPCPIKSGIPRLSWLNDRFAAMRAIALIIDLPEFGAKQRAAFRANESMIALRAAKNPDDADDVNNKKHNADRADGIIGDTTEPEALQDREAHARGQSDDHRINHDAQFQLRDARLAFEFQF
jgi:hypothetical protein